VIIGITDTFCVTLQQNVCPHVRETDKGYSGIMYILNQALYIAQKRGLDYLFVAK
jgi:hypothetical protein